MEEFNKRANAILKVPKKYRKFWLLTVAGNAYIVPRETETEKNYAIGTIAGIRKIRRAEKEQIVSFCIHGRRMQNCLPCAPYLNDKKAYDDFCKK